MDFADCILTGVSRSVNEGEGMPARGRFKRGIRSIGNKERDAGYAQVKLREGVSQGAGRRKALDARVTDWRQSEVAGAREKRSGMGVKAASCWRRTVRREGRRVRRDGRRGSARHQLPSAAHLPQTLPRRRFCSDGFASDGTPPSQAPVILAGRRLVRLALSTGATACHRRRRRSGM